MNIDFPFHIDRKGRTATTTDAAHMDNLIAQVLFTNLGERVNRPDFGSGLLQLVFSPNSPELAATLQFTMQAALQRWLGDVIEVQTLDVAHEESTLRILVRYRVRQTQELRTATFERRGLR
ncbi:GPW/gp25 family protein [Oculatella sp. LEGE 06141]|uniref:GPW/gp25 family protein n=1 Tax=Oculatella sp. LEGE 06141 TaxID=1828648 RepID=UPI00187FBDFD|nr:GPW/gp25 family protein [Oculatella sp. LEGE 06141]MBE9180047.1 GPW/gp25 family protein [Oculatella sp. LEGE 06141]